MYTSINTSNIRRRTYLLIVPAFYQSLSKKKVYCDRPLPKICQQFTKDPPLRSPTPPPPIKKVPSLSLLKVLIFWKKLHCRQWNLVISHIQPLPCLKSAYQTYFFKTHINKKNWSSDHMNAVLLQNVTYMHLILNFRLYRFLYRGSYYYYKFHKN